MSYYADFVNSAKAIKDRRFSSVEEIQQYEEESWDYALSSPEYWRNITRVGDSIFDLLLSKLYTKESLLFSRDCNIFIGLPYDSDSFRALFSYISRKAFSSGLVFVLAPVQEYTGDTFNISVCDFEMKLISPERR